MNNLSAPARSADSNSIHKYPWKWYLSDLKTVKKNGKKVFSCFSCGGGSTMGYKLAGYDVIGNCEIDPDMMKIYKENHHPKYSYLMDVRDFLKKDDLPEELFNLDILDGSPPCSVFSRIGLREKAWGKEKVFREGQKAQTLDDLFFVFIEIANKLKPKTIIAENVKGLLEGNAKGYVNEILSQFKTIGYDTQLFLLNSARMGVPQIRERAFFIAKRNDYDLPKLRLNFAEKPILFGEIRSENGKPVTGKDAELLKKAKPSDKYASWIEAREYNKKKCNYRHIISDTDIVPTMVSAGIFYRQYDKMSLSDMDIINAQTFPQDYNFLKQDVKYVCGMSVPPVMMAQIADQVYIQWLKEIN